MRFFWVVFISDLIGFEFCYICLYWCGVFVDGEIVVEVEEILNDGFV